MAGSLISSLECVWAISASRKHCCHCLSFESWIERNQITTNFHHSAHFSQAWTALPSVAAHRECLSFVTLFWVAITHSDCQPNLQHVWIPCGKLNSTHQESMFVEQESVSYMHRKYGSQCHHIVVSWCGCAPVHNTYTIEWKLVNLHIVNSNFLDNWADCHGSATLHSHLWINQPFNSQAHWLLHRQFELHATMR